MFRAGLCIATGILAVAVAWLGVAHFTSVDAAVSADAAPPDAKPAADTKDAKDAKDAKGVDLSALRDAVDTAAKRGENVDEIRKALDAFAKTAPKAGAGVSPQLQALRDAVDAANRKGENVEAIAKELVAVETAVAGKSLAKPRVEPARPEAEPFPNPGRPAFPFPQPFPGPLMPAAPAGIDVELFNKAMDLQRKAMELMLKNPRDPEVMKEAQKLRTEAAELLLKAAGGLGGAGGAGGLGGFGGVPMPIAPLFPNPDFGRIPDRARLGIRMERVPPVAVEQLGLEPNTGIAVSMVVPNSAAEKAGLKVHDIILQFAGKAVTDNTEDFIRLVSDVKAGEKIDLVVLRKGKKVELKGVELPEVKQVRPQPAPFDLPGLLDAPPKPPRPAPPLPKKD